MAWAKRKFDTRSATLKYDNASQIWQRLQNMSTLTKYVNAYEICQRLQNMTTLTKYDRIFQNLTCLIKFSLNGFSYGSNCPGRIFSPKVVTFFSTSTAVFEHFWRWVTCFVWYFWSIMSAGVGKTNFWTYHLMKTTWKPPLNTGDFEVFTHFFSFCTTFLCFRIKPKPSRT